MTLITTKLSAPFKLHNPRNKTIQEFNVKFDKNKNSFEKFLDFIDAYPDKRINVTFFGEFPMGVVSSINKISDNVYVRLTADNFMAYKEMSEKGCKFFFDAQYSAYNITMLDNLIQMGVSDVYPADDLLYNLQEVKDYCAAKGVGLRLVLNRIPSTAWNSGGDYKSPIFRPQDLNLLEKYFDAFEFDCGDPYDWAKFDVLCRAWFERGTWNGDLIEINDDLELSYPNMSVPASLTAYKIKCERRCNKRAGNQCDKCNQFVEIGNSMAEKGLLLKENNPRMVK